MNNTENVWFALNISVVSEASEAIEFALNELDASGTEINNLGVKPTATLVVKGYFRELPDEEIVRAQLDESLRIYGFSPAAIQGISSRRIGNVDWLYEWRKLWKATETDKFIVAPPWENTENSEKIVVTIEPGMAFGTGTHASTQLCLRAIEKSYQPGMSLLDVGTGTGVLAIAAAKLNSEFEGRDSKFKGYDTDEGSVAIAKENSEVNELGDRIDFCFGSISETDSEYDFVCANILIDVIVSLLPLLLGKSKRVLVLSGILREQKDDILEELKKRGVENPKVEVLGEWISVTILR